MHILNCCIALKVLVHELGRLQRQNKVHVYVVLQKSTITCFCLLLELILFGTAALCPSGKQVNSNLYTADLAR